jgi:hypothetical protein
LRLARAGAGAMPAIVMRGGAERRSVEFSGCRFELEPASGQARADRT